MKTSPLEDPRTIEAVVSYLKSLAADGFYGTVSLRYDKGRIVLVNVQQAILPQNIQSSPVVSKPRSTYVESRPSMQSSPSY